MLQLMRSYFINSMKPTNCLMNLWMFLEAMQTEVQADESCDHWTSVPWSTCPWVPGQSEQLSPSNANVFQMASSTNAKLDFAHMRHATMGWKLLGNLLSTCKHAECLPSCWKTQFKINQLWFSISGSEINYQFLDEITWGDGSSWRWKESSQKRLKLNKSIYDLEHSSHNWYEKIK